MGIENLDPEIRLAIDAQLLQIAKINCQIGVDTKADEKIEYRRQIRACLNEIKALDLEFWEQIVPDKKDKL